MSSLSSDQIRLAILELLLKEAQEEPCGLGVFKKKIEETLQISEKQADFNSLYLREKGLVKFNAVCSEGWWTKITAFGTDVVEHKERYASQFPFVQVTIQTQNIQGNAYGVVQAAGNAQVSFNQQVTDAFAQANSQVEAKSELTAEQKEEIKEYLKILAEELRNEKKDSGKIQKALEKLKQNASWLLPMLAQVVTEGVKIALGLP